MPNPVATFDTTLGVIKCEIYLEQMPITASNFIDLANSGFYNGLHFHRVIPDFMDQCVPTVCLSPLLLNASVLHSGCLDPVCPASLSLDCLHCQVWLPDLQGPQV